MPTPQPGETQEDFIGRCIPMVLDDETAQDNEQAIAICNSMWEENQQERAMPFTDTGQIAQSAIEAGLAFLSGNGELNQKQAFALFEALQADLESLAEAVTKTIDGKPRPAGDFLVVEDPEAPSTWHLPVKVDGVPDRGLADRSAVGIRGGG